MAQVFADVEALYLGQTAGSNEPTEVSQEGIVGVAGMNRVILNLKPLRKLVYEFVIVFREGTDEIWIVRGRLRRG